MPEFTIGIAGHTARIFCLFETTPQYCSRYPAVGEPEYTITVTETLLEQEQVLLDAEADREGMRRRHFTGPFLERNAICRVLAKLLSEHGILLLHGSTVAVDGKAYLFTAACGTGKSTHTRLWRQAFPDAVMINDDKTFLLPAGNGFLACGSPWSGKHGLDSNICVPLTGICILERGSENRIVPADAAASLSFLRSQLAEETPPGLGQGLLKVPAWRMQCTKDVQAAFIARATMAGKTL